MRRDRCLCVCVRVVCVRWAVVVAQMQLTRTSSKISAASTASIETSVSRQTAVGASAANVLLTCLARVGRAGWRGTPAAFGVLGVVHNRVWIERHVYS